MENVGPILPNTRILQTTFVVTLGGDNPRQESARSDP